MLPINLMSILIDIPKALWLTIQKLNVEELICWTIAGDWLWMTNGRVTAVCSIEVEHFENSKVFQYFLQNLVKNKPNWIVDFVDYLINTIYISLLNGSTLSI